MKTQMKTLMLVAALATSLFSAHALSEPLACADLQRQIEQKLAAKGVTRYALSVVERSESDVGKKVVGTCAGGTKKVLYSKKSESAEPNFVVDEPGKMPRTTVIRVKDNGGATHQFVGTKKEFKPDPWKRTHEVWGLTFSPEFEYQIRVRSENAKSDAGTQARATITEIRYKN